MPIRDARRETEGWLKGFCRPITRRQEQQLKMDVFPTKSGSLSVNELNHPLDDLTDGKASRLADARGADGKRMMQQCHHFSQFQ